jgi:tRNA1(Val) A37 N6-methylase TrmN6
VFVDLGCGKGKVLLMAAKFPFMQIVGVEVAAELAEQARKNVTSYRGAVQHHQRIEVRTGDAVDYEFPLYPLVIYCFNPFPEKVMRAALNNLQRSLGQHARETYLIYTYPVLESVVAEYAFLQLIDSGTNHRSYRASFGNRPTKSPIIAALDDQCIYPPQRR